MNYFQRNRVFFAGIVTIGLPIAIQNLLTTAVSVVDTLMVSTQGEASLAAVGLCSQFGSLLFSCYWGFASAGTTFFTQYWGADDRDGILSAFGIAAVFMTLVGAIFTLLGLFAPGFVMGIYTDSAAIKAEGIQYLRIIAYSYPAQVMALALSCLMRSTENVRVPLMGSIASMITNTLLNWVLIFGNLGAPAMGVRGAAIASVIAVYVNVLVLYLFALAEPGSLATRFRQHFSWPAALVKEYLVKAAPMIVNEVLYGTGQLMINMVLGRQGTAGVAAMSLFRVLEGMVFSFFIGLTNASAIMVGKQVGAGELEGAYQDAKRFAWICPLFTLAIGLVLLPLMPLILRAFTLGDVARGYVIWMMAIYCIGGPIRTSSYLMNNTYRAGGEPVVGMVFEMGSLFLISVPLVYLCGMVWHLPYLLVFAAMYVEEVPKLAIGVWYLRSAKWIKPVTEVGRAQLQAFWARRAAKAQ